MTPRLSLDDLRVDDADEMVDVLAAPAIYAFTGGAPPSLAELRARYEAQVAGSGLVAEQWRNWIVRVDHIAIGFVQATVTPGGATLAWLIGPAWQGRGHASAAVGAMIRILVSEGVDMFDAWIAPGHAASERVATRVGFVATHEVDEDGEVRWVSGRPR